MSALNTIKSNNNNSNNWQHYQLSVTQSHSQFEYEYEFELETESESEKLIDCHLSLSHLLLTHRLLKLICRLRPIWVYKEKEKKNAVKNTKSFCPYTALEFSLIIIGSVAPTSPRGALPS